MSGVEERSTHYPGGHYHLVIALTTQLSFSGCWWGHLCGQLRPLPHKEMCPTSSANSSCSNPPWIQDTKNWMIDSPKPITSPTNPIGHVFWSCIQSLTTDRLDTASFGSQVRLRHPHPATAPSSQLWASHLQLIAQSPCLCHTPKSDPKYDEGRHINVLNK